MASRARTAADAYQNGNRRNLVHNGAMQVAQRGAQATGLGAATGYFTLDRWNMVVNSASTGRFTMDQASDGPAGFANCLKITTTTADTSIAAGEVLILRHSFEGQDLQQLQKGTATAKQVTVSFYVKGNAAATYTCELYDAVNDRTINQAFAVTTAWNRIELTFAADTSDPLTDNNARNLDLQFILHGGTTFSGGTFSSNAWKDTVNNTRMAESHTSIFDATSRTFFITGVQMEIGTTATDFEHRSYGEELATCQRYFERIDKASQYSHPGNSYATNVSVGHTLEFKVTKRTAPTLTVNALGESAGQIAVTSATGSFVSTQPTSIAAQVAVTYAAIYFAPNGIAGLTDNSISMLYGAGHFLLDADL
jgi:hypothetical protein